MTSLFFVLAIVTICYALVSAKLENSIVTPPMVFTGLGVLIALTTPQLVEAESAVELLEIVAEITLVIVLFIDASRIKLPLLIKDYRIPLRLLGMGLPLTILLGALIAKLVFPEFSLWEVMLLSAILAPTDAALGQAVVSSPKVPQKIRQSLNVESGLNDGIVLPLVMLCAAFAGASGGEGGGSWLGYWLKQVTLGPLVGVGVGWFGGNLLERAKNASWLNRDFQQLSGVSLAMLAWSGAILIGGNGFIAAFVAGMAVSCHADKIGDSMREFGEAEGQWLALATFLLFGMVAGLPVFKEFQVGYLIYAVLSLTVIRMIPVTLSLLGLGFHGPTYWFVGWFGPRGLATLLFALLVVSKFDVPQGDQIFNIGVFTVLLSILAHGLSAVPGASWYQAALERVCSPESLERQSSAKHRLKFKMPESN